MTDASGYIRWFESLRLEYVPVSTAEFDIGDKRQPVNDRRYARVPTTLLPRSESLKDTVDRVMPYWHEAIVPALWRGERVLVAAMATACGTS